MQYVFQNKEIPHNFQEVLQVRTSIRMIFETVIGSLTFKCDSVFDGQTSIDKIVECRTISIQMNSYYYEGNQVILKRIEERRVESFFVEVILIF